eukprot:g7795.t1 g7795   contig26:296359-297353(+)
MVPTAPLSILLLACDTRRVFLSTTCASAFVVLRPPSSTAVVDGVSSDLYLAQPMGVARRTTQGEDGINGDEVVRPSAPLEFLLPAARVGLYIYQTLAIAEEIGRLKSPKDYNARVQLEKAMNQLDNLLLSPPSFIKTNDPTVTRKDPYNLPPVVGEIAKQQQKQRERRQNSVEVGITPQFLSGSKEEKRSMILNDKLPTAVDVIRSDLDARDLYRNVVQTKLEDAQAEWVYQKKVMEEGEGLDVGELVELLIGANVAVDKWFSFIPDGDIQEALEVVRREQNL